MSGSNTKASDINNDKVAANNALTEVVADQKEIADLIAALELRIEQGDQLAAAQA